MGLAANSISIVQFTTTGKLPKKLDDWLAERLGAYAFQPIDETTDEESTGWVHFDDALLAAFPDASVFRRDRYAMATLRQDKRRIPTLLARHLYAKECAAWLAERPQMRGVPKQVRGEIRDQVAFELRARTLPTPATIDVAWQVDTGIVTATTTSKAGVELVRELFARTFEGQNPLLLHPMARAERVAPEALRPKLKEANPAFDKDIVTQIEENRWFGHDFLLWLMHRTKHSDSVYTIDQPGPAPKGASFVADLGDRLVLEGEDEHGPQRTTLTGHQVRYAEANTALKLGKRFREAAICFESSGENWQMNLRADTFAFGSYKSPAVKMENDERTDPVAERYAFLLERLGLMEAGLQMFDSLLSHFVQARFGVGWDKLHGEIRRALDK